MWELPTFAGKVRALTSCQQLYMTSYMDIGARWGRYSLKPLEIASTTCKFDLFSKGIFPSEKTSHIKTPQNKTQKNKKLERGGYLELKEQFLITRHYFPPAAMELESSTVTAVLSRKQILCILVFEEVFKLNILQGKTIPSLFYWS